MDGAADPRNALGVQGAFRSPKIVFSFQVVEISQYVSNQDEIIRIRADLAAEGRDPEKGRKLRARMLALEDANKAMSIRPLLDAGEFSTISESLTEQDLQIRKGKIVDMLENAVDQLPGGARGVAKNVLITKDTALFKGLNRMVQYGDFTAKAVLYDHLKAKGRMSEREIMDVISE